MLIHARVLDPERSHARDIPGISFVVVAVLIVAMLSWLARSIA